MTLNSFMVNQKGYIFYHEGMKSAGAGTLKFWWVVSSAIATLFFAIDIKPYLSWLSMSYKYTSSNTVDRANYPKKNRDGPKNHL